MALAGWKTDESSSSWGCELKSVLFRTYLICPCHPLREDVSWNIDQIVDQVVVLVILFVRMWVEMLCRIIWRSSGERSSSSWGCELKYFFARVSESRRPCHPLREDVSWNVYSPFRPTLRHVILFVRMWVEMMLDTVVLVQVAVILLVKMWVKMLFIGICHSHTSSSSSWRCELKFWRVQC